MLFNLIFQVVAFAGQTISSGFLNPRFFSWLMGCLAFDPTNPAAALQQNQSTKLTANFQKNADDIETRNILYCDLPQFYTWQWTQNCWRRRARINEEEYIAFIHVKGTLLFTPLIASPSWCKSFNDLLTINDDICGHFKHACQALNPLEGHQEWHNCLHEATINHTASHLTNLFVYSPILLPFTTNDFISRF